MHETAPCYAFSGHCRNKFAARTGGMLRKLLPLALCLALFACAKQAPPPVVERTLPPVGFESPEFFVNNLVPSGQELTSWKDMGPSVRKSLRYVNS